MSRSKWRKNGKRSGYEASVEEDLLKRKINHKYEDTKLLYTRLHKYTPDYALYGKNGKVIYIECKGNFPAGDRGKMLSVRNSNPTLDLRMLFQRDQPIRKGSKTTYIDWCNKHGFLGAVGTSIPEEWIKELNT